MLLHALEEQLANDQNDLEQARQSLEDTMRTSTGALTEMLTRLDGEICSIVEMLETDDCRDAFEPLQREAWLKRARTLSSTVHPAIAGLPRTASPPEMELIAAEVSSIQDSAIDGRDLLFRDIKLALSAR